MTQNTIFLPKAWLNSSNLKRLAPILLHSFTLAFALISVLIGYIVFLNPTRTALPSQLEAKVLGPEQKIDIFPIDKGRFRVILTAFSNEELFLTLDKHRNAKFLMIRNGYDIQGTKAASNLRISVLNGESIDVLGNSISYTPRYFLPLPSNQEKVVIKIENLDKSTSKLIIDEIGLTKSQSFGGKEGKLLIKLLLAALGIAACFGSLIFIFIDQERAALHGSLYFVILAVTIHFCFLHIGFSPEWGRDLRAYFASGPLQETPGSNLNYGLHMASSILQGRGPLICDKPSWCRMPGYGYVLAMSGYSLNMLQMAINSVLLQIFLFGITLSFFFWSAIRIMPIFAAGLISTITSLLPFRFYYLQVESFMPTILLLILSSTCLFIEKYSKTVNVPIKYHFLIHSSFAFWFFNRTDILPAWALLSLILYIKIRHNWKFFLIPLGLVLSIGLSWALFKLSYTGEFSMTTYSIGASFMAGLWEIPHKFIWTATDQSFFSWMASADKLVETKEGANFAVSEVLRFCATYPIYICSLAWHKFLFFAKSFSQFLDFGMLSWCRLWLLFVIISSFLVKHKRLQTLLLAWVIFFNVPTFFIFYSSEGRFYEAPNICLFAAAIPLLCDSEYYRKARIHKLKFAAVMLIVYGITKFGYSIDEYVIGSDDFRYWSPFLDPSRSTLNVVRNLDD